MKATISLSRTAGLLAGALFVLAGARAAEADALPTLTGNYITVGAGGATASGSGAAYQARTQHAKSGAAGIEDFSYGYDLSKDVNLQIDGHLLAGDEDYLAQFKLTKNEFGTLEVGYKRFRTFYDGAGGFFPGNNQFLPIYRRALYVDRGKLFVNATLALPKAPVITFKYSNDSRTGRKDSTIWGDSDLTGIPIFVGTGASNPISSNRKILPAYIQLGERQETWEATIRHTVGNTTAVASIGGDRINNRNSRSVDRFVGELRPWPPYSFTTPTLIPNAMNSNPNRGFDVEGFKETAWTAGVRLETVVSEKVTAFAGLNYRKADIDVDAQRLINTDVMTAAGLKSGIAGFYVGEPTNVPRISASRPPYSYTSTGSMSQEVLTGNIGLQTKPLPNLGVDLALKGENYKDSGNVTATYITTAITSSTGAVASRTDVAPQVLNNTEKPWTPAVDVRYSGIRTLALYGSWEYRSVKQNEENTYGAYNFATTATNISNAASIGTTLAYNEIKEKHENITIGANWTPVSFFSGRAELFSKDHENKFTGYATSAGSFYTLNYDIYGTKLTGTFKPLTAVSLTVRYIAQKGKASTAEDGFNQGDTNDAKRQTLSGTVNWNPNKTVYVQVNGSLVYDSIVTAYPYVTGTAKDVIRNAKNNYYNGDATVGFAIDKETDVQLQGTYYRANNFDPAQAYATLPLGASGKEYTLTAGVKYKIDAKTLFNAKVGYFESKNDTTGGFADFRGPLAYVSVTRAF